MNKDKAKEIVLVQTGTPLNSINGIEVLQDNSIDDYVFIHKDDYEEYMRFKENTKTL